MFDRLLRGGHRVQRRVRRFDLNTLLSRTGWVTRLDRFRYATGLVSALVVIGVVTALSNTTKLLSFLLFPPLAAATYQLFAHPGEASSSPRNLVLGLTSGAVSGWTGVAVARRLFELKSAEPFVVSVPAAVLTILFTVVLLWFVDADLAPSFAAGLLVLLLDVSPAIYVLNVTGASLLVAVGFHGWQQMVYDRRAERLFGTTSSRGNVLVPVRSAADEAVVRFGSVRCPDRRQRRRGQPLPGESRRRGRYRRQR